MSKDVELFMEDVATLIYLKGVRSAEEQVIYKESKARIDALGAMVVDLKLAENKLNKLRQQVAVLEILYPELKDE